MSYIGNPIVSTDFPKDTFSGNGSTTAFTMQIAPASVNSVIVVVSGITQDPSTYTISGTTLTFSAAPPTGTSNISVRHLGVAGIPNTPSAASVTQDKLGSNVAGTGPAFSATNSSQQSITASTYTKVLFQTENFDTNNNFASSTFTPTVAGYYQITASLNHNYGVSGGTQIATCIYKNGSLYQLSTIRLSVAGQGPYGGFQAQALIYCNGSTDYIDVYAYSTNVSPSVAASDAGGTTNFSGVLVRAA